MSRFSGSTPSSLSFQALIARRLAQSWPLLAGVFAGITVAITVIVGAPVYIAALDRQSVNTAIDRALQESLDVVIFAPHVAVAGGGLETTEQSLAEAIRDHISPVYRGHQRYLRGPTYLAGLPSRPLPSDTGTQVSRGYFQHLSDLEGHVTFVAGSMAGSALGEGDRGPLLEGVMGASLADALGLRPGDVVTFAASLSDPVRVSVRLTGLFDPTDPAETYWRGTALRLVEPRPLEESPERGILVDPNEPPLAVFLGREAMSSGVGRAYPETRVSSTWYVSLDREGLKGWSVGDTRRRLDALEGDVIDAIDGVGVLTGVDGLLDDFERRSFFSSVPLLLLLTLLVITLLYYLSMMVSYLVKSREDDAALLRSRGVGVLALLRLYAVEGAAMTLAAVIVAPFLAMAAVALAGKLPYFYDATGGDALPVELRWTPFLVAAGAGVVALAVFVVPVAVGSRMGLIVHALRRSRPPTVPLFQRYYLDVLVLIIGGLVFWELHQRGQVVSGGLFEDVQVNEALLLAPVLLLAAVALVFMRLFPSFIRFISGESRALLDLVALATATSLAATVAVRERADGGELAWLVPVGLIAGVAGVYWATRQSGRRLIRLAGLVLQTGLVIAVVSLEPLETDDASFIPTISLIALVPAQVAFLFFRATARRAPVWVVLGLFRMARDPLQHTWLVLLLVMVTGLGILTTTVGGTLQESQEQRVYYEVGANVRVSDIPEAVGLTGHALRETYGEIPAVNGVSTALRGSGAIGGSARFDVLAIESRDFQEFTWYRDDFSARSLDGVMSMIRSEDSRDRMALPAGATEIGVWAKPGERYRNMYLWMVFRDARGQVDTASLGEVGPPEWHLMTAKVPGELEPPLELASIQLFESGFGAGGTAGSILLDSLHVAVGPSKEERLLDSFDSEILWTAVPTSTSERDSFALVGEDAFQGLRSGLFTFGQETADGIRGLYQNPAGSVSVVASDSFIAWARVRVGDTLMLEMMGQLMPVTIRDRVSYFPTMDPAGSGFLLADLDSLSRHLNVLNPRSNVKPNELFLLGDAGAGEAVRDTVAGRGDLRGRVEDTESLLAAIRLDPLLSAGWRVLVPVSIAIVVVTAALGYVTYLMSSRAGRRGEIGVLRSLGLSGFQLISLLTVEHLAIAAIGVGVGTWAGFQMSEVMVSSVAVTETGERVVPPFVLTTDWPLMLPVYGALAVIFLGALYWLARGLLRLDLHTVTRGDG